MKYLGDSLVGLRYYETDSAILLIPNGDPTFLNTEFKVQPVFKFLTSTTKKLNITFSMWNAEKYGSGWSWNDFLESYMCQRSAFPIYGNLIKFKLTSDLGIDYFFGTPDLDGEFIPSFFNKREIFKTRSPLQYNHLDKETIQKNLESLYYDLKRPFDNNSLFTVPVLDKKVNQTLTLNTDDPLEILAIIADTIKKQINIHPNTFPTIAATKKIHSQPTDSVLKPMMHRSDNFFAEQSLLMVSNERLGVMNDAKIIDTLLKTDFKDLPQKPKWVDGSGLSRYNLFTPQDFVAILNKMKNEFGMERIKVILPTGGTGTISNYYKADSNFIFAKTGTLSGVVAFSGFLYTKKGKLLIFSTLVNNHEASSTAVRRAVEKFIQGIREKY
jgi:D-alanyl-D-alanine carboxypeptidase/D-alanyl-D-alanine-endopeptidase (penicillin-binding protein 4)